MLICLFGVLPTRRKTYLYQCLSQDTEIMIWINTDKNEEIVREYSLRSLEYSVWNYSRKLTKKTAG